MDTSLYQEDNEQCRRRYSARMTKVRQQKGQEETATQPSDNDNTITSTDNNNENNNDDDDDDDILDDVVATMSNSESLSGKGQPNKKRRKIDEFDDAEKNEQQK